LTGLVLCSTRAWAAVAVGAFPRFWHCVGWVCWQRGRVVWHVAACEQRPHALLAYFTSSLGLGWDAENQRYPPLPLVVMATAAAIAALSRSAGTPNARRLPIRIGNSAEQPADAPAASNL
jgi:hypothetical protein